MSLPSPGVLSGGRVVTPDGVLSPGWIRLAGRRIDAVGPGEPPTAPGLPVTHLGGQWVLPGFVDMHVHGGGGTSFTQGTAEDARAAAGFHRRHGSTTVVASLVTAPVTDLEARSAMLAGLAREDVVAGIHLEGPFLSAARCGAQDPRYMIAPDVAAFERLHAAAAGWLRVITLAPELPGASALIEAAVRAGDRNGPSRCRPAMRPSSARPASMAARASSSANGAVTRLASRLVLPRAR